LLDLSDATIHPDLWLLPFGNWRQEMSAVLTSVERLHTAARAPEAWTGALESVADLVGGAHAMLIASTGDGGASLAAFARVDERDYAAVSPPFPLSRLGRWRSRRCEPIAH